MQAPVYSRDFSKRGPVAPFFHRWLNHRDAEAFDKLSRQELMVAAVAVLLAPAMLVFAFVWIFFQPEFLDQSVGMRVLFALALPFLLPAAYVYVVSTDLLWPLAKRVWLRAKLMRQAKRAVRELMSGLA